MEELKSRRRESARISGGSNAGGQSSENSKIVPLSPPNISALTPHPRRRQQYYSRGAPDQFTIGVIDREADFGVLRRRHAPE